MSSYGQFCPVSKAMDALGRWGVRWIPELGDRDLGWPEALASGLVELDGAAWARRGVPRWLGQSPLADTPRAVAAAAGR